ncbi:SUMF1/EgtB/PvdO family nonheme iron enzyme [Candidatus Viridilinea mediisalina]|uniref:Sulfatase-modifying factor enzyme-like domain-containing protein n=1 Tax=Candidatus Viridilinea mediisalina TaxID=2024553 RepID=A0A2A6RDG0_9CHLR|nr:SUMF1/EgtB/PvdO family nonheme iron enzyme [Candidatus Viridilinea mediisalina]PDV99139.1 hypothetical protein CJ255_21710 [Candidatus Viridilinea mediisalina]
MLPLRLPRTYYLQRAVASYERAGDARAAAAVLANFGTPEAHAEAAQRYLALDDLAAAGESFLAADDPERALACFQQAKLPERALACLERLGDLAAQGALLLELGHYDAALPRLTQALSQCEAEAEQVRLRFHIAQALGLEAGEAHYRAALAQLEQLPLHHTSVASWLALAAWGEAVGRHDRIQEGYAEALRQLAALQDWPRWESNALRYQAAAEAMGNHRLAQLLKAELAALSDPVTHTLPADPVTPLLTSGQWALALAELQPRAQQGDPNALLLLAVLVEGAARGHSLPIAPPLTQRLEAARLLAEVGDPRLLDPVHGDAPLGAYWCSIEPGPFWYGAYLEADQQERAYLSLQRAVMPYPYRIGRYPVTNAEYRHFIEAGGYQEPRWWTAHGWDYLQHHKWRAPHFWQDAAWNQPNQPVVGVTWWEAMAYCTWLTHVGHQHGWLPQIVTLRLPTSLEWERAARSDDQRRYPWGDQPAEPEHANYQATGIGRTTPVGCFPAGQAPSGALDLAGNVMEWLSTPVHKRYQPEPLADVSAGERVLLSWSHYGDHATQLNCGARSRFNPYYRYHLRGFRILWCHTISLADSRT